MSLFCTLLTPAAANWAGLLGTALLGWAVINAIPLSKDLYRLSQSLLEIAEAERQAKSDAAGQAADPSRNAEADVLARLNAAKKDVFERAERHSASLQKTWTRMATIRTVAGFVLTLASSGLPLLAPWLTASFPEFCKVTG